MQPACIYKCEQLRLSHNITHTDVKLIEVILSLCAYVSLVTACMHASDS